MEYTDYKSGRETSREQYIANGLERGELLIELECGCVVIQDRTADAYIVYCYKHNAAPDLYEASKELLKHYLGIVNSGDCGFWNPEEEAQVINSRKAIAKAEGGK